MFMACPAWRRADLAQRFDFRLLTRQFHAGRRAGCAASMIW
jgi:hypothetical protein